ncbi:glutathione ABC transporter permease GsiD [Alkalihalobacillus alcalophilus ATCC 27647 = CGMCC 1.3604]|uniref:Dipeptide/oligopeptide transporter n=2 Tax=Alkalihalobacillus alcalophilus ATCC 27647 = CGMCC 1.3604 TaxID=1218173 RepID=J8TVK8_ALKAL|nr:ABC transporter permease [Alkalihalobacillus alcalophilus]AFV25667.1 dipeptide/oligopeptide transporter [Alkalihalobacillus alcalophilus ATCC 27647 = CGMCC 1.3604]MED1562935.1 ABC transporter permease [Alkalihalobacillus alcalophilus]THG91943.1 glutathione ABC transporter permease GsiD [Alkalihalobacillus alcalophilus ATCC 27647 = CGMCC 1.3604]
MAQTSSLEINSKVPSPRVEMLKAMMSRFFQNKLAVFGGIFTFLLIFIALFAPFIVPYDPTAQNYSMILQGPSAEHWFGTDEIGRDVLSRVIYGAQVSLQAGLISVGIALAIGVPIGLISGYYRGFWDEFIIMRITDAMLSFPPLVLALALAAVLGAGLENAMIAIGIVLTPNFIRLIRSEVIAHREREYVEAGKASGLKDWRIISKHILPNTMAPIMVQATLAIASAIISEASLSYLGLGTQPPTASWGAMLSAGQGYLATAPWIALFPGLFIFLTVISINLFGDGIRDMLDPKLK